MTLNELEDFGDEYREYFDSISEPENQCMIEKARKEMHRIKGEDKFQFTPRFLSMGLVGGHIERCKKTIDVINRILKETREGERTPLSDIIPRRRQYNVPWYDLYERTIDLVDPRFPSIMEGRIDGCIDGNRELISYEINANRAGWENSRSFCSIYDKYFAHLLNGHKTVDFADGWESIIKHTLGKLNGDKVIYLTEQRGRESIDALRGRGIDIDFVRFQNLKKLMKSGELEITKDDVTYKGDRVDLICRFLRTHQVFEIPELCECVRRGNVHLINQMDAFFGGLKTLLIRFQDPDVMSSYAELEEMIRIPESTFLTALDEREITKKRDGHVLKFGNRGGGKRVYFGSDFSTQGWRELITNSRDTYPETSMIQKFVNPSITPNLEDGRISFYNTSCDIFVFTTNRPMFGGVFSRWSDQKLVNFKTGGIKETIFI
jgi:hypothetical protein